MAARVAFVTGASRGIGKGIALRLARDGFNIAINDVVANKSGIEDTVKEIEGIGRKALGVTADVSKYGEIEENVKEVASKLGSVDVAVANAGIAQVATLLETTEQDRHRMMDVNVHGVMNTDIACANQMIKQGKGGRIINAASIVAFNTFPLLGHYSASKWAVRGWTQVAAKEWAKYGIRVCAYAPGIVDTPMWELIDERAGKQLGLKKGETFKKYCDELILLGRPSVPEDLGKLVSFLASDDAEYITAQTIVCDGGIVAT